MDILRHLSFCPPGTPWFDTHAAAGAAEEEDFAATHDPVPDGWERTPGSEWVLLTPPGVRLPGQGWKIHVSATPESAERVLGTTVKYCTAEGLTFKFLRSPRALLRRNSKYGERSGSGKFITLYPLDEAQFARVLDELGGLLDGEPGPYILSDLRWRSGPLYVRYGGFAVRTMRSPSGETVYCIENPDGELVPDRRGPGFRPPEWVTLPDCLAEAMAARNAGTLRDFPYRVTKALHFSNGGGVYLGTDTRTGRQVLLREARPHAGLDSEGRDAVARYRKEHWALERLAGLPAIPELVDHRKGHEHHFLVRAYVEGTPLSQLMRKRNPLLNGVTAPESYAEYTAWALRVLERIEEGVRGMHERGVVFGDLHPGNILVGPDPDPETDTDAETETDTAGTAGTAPGAGQGGPDGQGGPAVTFIDFETASAVEDDAVQQMGAVGFMAPAGYTGTHVDRYALGSLRLAVFAPLAGALQWSPQKVEQLLDLITAHFPVPTDYAARTRSALAPPPAATTRGTAPGTAPAGAIAPAEAPAPAEGRARTEGRAPAPGEAADEAPLWTVPERDTWPALRDALAQGIRAAATPQRLDRLFPGDAEQFLRTGGGTGFAHGAAGVLWALARTGARVEPEWTDWLVERAHAQQDPRPGFAHGHSGIAYALAELGRVDEAADLLARAGTPPADAGPEDGGPAATALGEGLAGIGLTHLDLARRTGSTDLLEKAVAIGARLAERHTRPAREEPPAPADPAGRRGPAPAGLLDGATGEALLLLRLYEETGETGLLDAAGAALDADLTALGLRPGAPLPSEPLGRLPLLAVGIGGTGMVLHDHLVHRPDFRWAPVRDTVREATALRFTTEAGLFLGRAGVLTALLHLSDGEVPAEALRPQLAALGLHAVRHEDRPAFLGRECLRLSTDVATGTAGVLLALHSVFEGGRVQLPFF
ncbi:hypothetical protein DEH18_33075 [Streptomyces sp. NHF165]|nr:protein kinase/lanthionine synthetase C family protein [Streptomyces sp. NHF165]QHF97875.1 hypothetical protein DEH18_33075 [Streptomyces sp. NHF165]